MATPPDWTVVDGALERTFELPSFPDAIAFVNRVAELAEAENHHPDIGVSYRKVTLRWTTHSEGGITGRDEDLARRSADLASALARKLRGRRSPLLTGTVPVKKV